MKVGLLLVGALVPASVMMRPVPSAPTAPAGLSNRNVQHHELLRIDRDFGREQFEIVLDGWTSRLRTRHIDDVRFWWVNTLAGDRRKPFSAKLRRYVRFGYHRKTDGGLAVRFSGDRKEFRFTVEVDGDGSPAAFTDVRRKDGTLVPHCRGTRGRLLARRFFGIPVGIKAMRVSCVDDLGRAHRGEVPFRTLASGKPYPSP